MALRTIYNNNVIIELMKFIYYLCAMVLFPLCTSCSENFNTFLQESSLSEIKEISSSEKPVQVNSMDDVFDLAQADGLFSHVLNNTAPAFIISKQDVGTRTLGELIPMSYTGYQYFWSPDGLGEYISLIPQHYYKIFFLST